jgi:hypothetical protein
MDLSDARLDRLLSGRDQLSVGEKEQILDQVLSQVAQAEPAETRFPWRVPRWAFAALALVLVVPPALLLWRNRQGSEFTARGGPGAAPALEPLCLGADGGAGACAQGGKLFFKLSPGRFQAFAALALAPDGKTLWYFPNDTLATSVDLARSKPSGILDQAIALDDRHAPGDYTLYGVFSERPLTKEEVRQAIQEPGRPGIAVVKRRLHVEERQAP